MSLAVALAVALVCGTVLQHHHHDADGSMCLAVACHDCLCHHQHDAPVCDGHDCPGRGCGDGCGMHLDSFCCGHQDSAAVPAVHDMLLCDAFVVDLSACGRLQDAPAGYARPAARAVGAGHRLTAGLRAPPADNLC